jgi:hypothetical protein
VERILARFVVVNHETYWTAERLAWRSARLGVVWTVAVGICSFAWWSVLGGADPRFAGLVATILAAVVFLLVPLVYFWRNGVQIAQPGRALLAGLCFGAASGVTRWAVAVVYGLLHDPGGRFFWYQTAGLIRAPIAYAVLFLAFGFVCRLWFGRIIQQDGTICPGCLYSLIGNTTMVCPECGRPFTFEELETTEEEFRRQHQAKC